MTEQTEREKLKAAMLLAMSEVHCGNAGEGRRIVDAALLAIEAAGARVVPVEMTIEMDVAATEAWRADQAWEQRSRSIYAAAVSASPYAPEQKDAPK